MKVKLSTVITDLDGKAIPKNDKKEDLTVQDVLVVCLQTPLKGDDEDDGAARIKKFNIMKGLHTAKKDELVMDSGDITLIKERILKIYPSPEIYGRMCEAFGDTK